MRPSSQDNIDISCICFHEKLVPFKDDLASQRCSYCQKVPELGMIYQCSKGKFSSMPAQSDFPELEYEMRKYSVGAQQFKKAQDTVKPPANSAALPVCRDELAISKLAINRPRHPSRATDCNFKICPPCKVVWTGPFEQRVLQRIKWLQNNMSNAQGLAELSTQGLIAREYELGPGRAPRHYPNLIPGPFDRRASPPIGLLKATMRDVEMGSKSAGLVRTNDFVTPSHPRECLWVEDRAGCGRYDTILYDGPSRLYVANASDNDGASPEHDEGRTPA